MVSSAKTTSSTDLTREFWINNNGKPLLMEPLNKKEIKELFHIVMANIKTTKTIMQNPIKLTKNCCLAL